MPFTFGSVDRQVAFDPRTAFPLDKREYFESKADAIKAAKTAVEVGSDRSNYYFGQLITVVEADAANAGKLVTKLYAIHPNYEGEQLNGGILVEVGTGVNPAPVTKSLVWNSCDAEGNITILEPSNTDWQEF